MGRISREFSLVAGVQKFRTASAELQAQQKNLLVIYNVPADPRPADEIG